MGSVLQNAEFETVRKLRALNLSELGVVPVCVAPGGEIFSHSHTLIEEVIIVLEGKGKVQIENEITKVGPGSIAIVPAGQFHALCNTGKKDLRATVVYNANVDRAAVDRKDRKTHFASGEASLDEICAELKSLKKAYKKLKKKVK